MPELTLAAASICALFWIWNCFVIRIFYRNKQWARIFRFTVFERETQYIMVCLSVFEYCLRCCIWFLLCTRYSKCRMAFNLLNQHSRKSCHLQRWILAIPSIQTHWKWISGWRLGVVVISKSTATESIIIYWSSILAWWICHTIDSLLTR